MDRFRNNTAIVHEITVRIILYTLFIGLEYLEPFARKIHPQEAWMYKYPVRANYVSYSTLWLIIIVFPSSIIIREYFHNKNKIEMYASFLSLTLNYGLVGFVTQFLKIIVGRPRPNFMYRCFPNGEGSDFNRCTGYKRYYLDGRKSFPSGHAAFAFSSMFFISILLAGKLKIFVEGGRGKTGRLCFCILPLLLATAVAVSRTCDYYHHYEDVICGSLLGITISYVTYRQYYPSVYSSNAGVPYVIQI